MAERDMEAQLFPPKACRQIPALWSLRCDWRGEAAGRGRDRRRGVCCSSTSSRRSLGVQTNPLGEVT